MNIIFTLLFPLLIYCSLGLLLYAMQERMIFKGGQLPDNYKFKCAVRCTELYKKTNDGGRLHALKFKNNKNLNDDRKVVLYLHGNEKNLNWWSDFAKTFTDMGLDVLMPDYRGYGKSRGVRTERLLFSDVQLWYEELLKNYNENNIYIYGRSLGTGFAVWLASKNKPAALILETPYNRLNNAAPSIVKLFPFGFLEKYPIRSDQYIKNVTCPLTIFHGTADKTIPYKSAQSLFNSAMSSKKEMLTLQGGGHGDLPSFPEFLPILKKSLL